MSTEELASRELAKWREKESKHQLEMIEQLEKKKAEELRSKPLRKKTHKGEVEVSVIETENCYFGEHILLKHAQGPTAMDLYQHKR